MTMYLATDDYQINFYTEGFEGLNPYSEAMLPLTSGG